MFDVVISFLTEFVDYIPPLIAIILCFNIISDLLWGSK